MDWVTVQGRIPKAQHVLDVCGLHAKILLSVLALVRGFSSHTFLMYWSECLGE